MCKNFNSKPKNSKAKFLTILDSYMENVQNKKINPQNLKYSIHELFPPNRRRSEELKAAWK